MYTYNRYSFNYLNNVTMQHMFVIKRIQMRRGRKRIKNYELELAQKYNGNLIKENFKVCNLKETVLKNQL